MGKKQSGTRRGGGRKQEEAELLRITKLGENDKDFGDKRDGQREREAPGICGASRRALGGQVEGKRE